MADEKTSFWKKELHVRPRKKVDAGYLDPEAVSAREEKKPSLLKREIHLRKPKADRVEQNAAKAEARRQSAEQKASGQAARWADQEARKAAQQESRPRKPERAAPAATPSEKTSIWKKEISFGRKKTPVAPVPPVHHVPESAAAPEVRPVATDWTLVAAPDPAPVPPRVAPPTPPPAPKPVLVEEETVRPQPAPLAPVPAPPFNPAAPKPVVVEAETLVLPPAAAAEPELVVPEPVELAPPPAPGRAPVAAVAAPEPPAAEEKAPKKSRAQRSKEKRSHRGSKKIVGIKIGASQISAARVSNNGSVELHQIAREPLEPGIVVAGELRDPDALAAALKDFFKKHKLPKRGIRLGISNNRIGVRLFEISGVEDGDQLRNAVRFRAQEALPIAVDDAVMDFHVVGETVDANGAPAKRVILVVAYKDLVERYAGAFRKAGLKLLGVDLEAFGLLRALGGDSDPEMDGENRTGLVVVSVGHDRSTFAVSDGRVCEFTRVLDWGGSTLDSAIGGALELPPAEAQAIKLQLSLADASVVPANLTPEQGEMARDAVRRALEGFARDLVSSLRFYQGQPDSLSIRELVLTGGTAELPGLAAELERLLDVRVRVGDPLGRVKVGRRVKRREGLGSMAAAIGLGIDD